MVLDPEKNVLSLGNILLRSWRTNGVPLEKCFRFENLTKITSHCSSTSNTKYTKKIALRTKVSTLVKFVIIDLGDRNLFGAFF